MRRIGCIGHALVVAVALGVGIGSALAVEPDERMADPLRESRARAISAELRCLVCQNQSIDDSNAPLARDLRLLVRERLQAGNSDAQVISFVVERYGEFVLLRPRFNAHTIILWLAPLALLLAIIGALLSKARKAQPASQPSTPLSIDEQKRLEGILADQSDR